MILIQLHELLLGRHEILVNISDYDDCALPFLLNLVDLEYLTVLIDDFVSGPPMDVLSDDLQVRTPRQGIESFSSVTQALSLILLIVTSLHQTLAQIVELRLWDAVAIVYYVKAMLAFHDKSHFNLLGLHVN